jgi:O-antigen biosynthesis protein WbqP
MMVDHINDHRREDISRRLPAQKMIRLLDVILSLIGISLGSPVLLFLLLLGFFDTGSPLFRQERVGRFQKPFTLIKFRTMHRNTASVATHLANAGAITPFGRLLRRTKLDELPQLWNVLKGDMSLVGPRPCLFSQTELIEERAKRGVFDARPGITGLAQVNDIDMSAPELLAETDAKMLSSFRLPDYFRYIVMTILGKGAGDRVRT